MTTTPNTISPLPSRTDGLGIFPSGDSLSRNSVYSYGHTRSSTCTVLSFAQQFHPEKTPSPAGLTRTTTIRTNLKEIQKSPLPHRFNLVPSSKRRVPEQPSKIPRSSTQWRWKSGQEEIESRYSTRSPSLYATSPDPQSTQLAEERNGEKRTILEDLLSDALDSPVFDCIATFSPPCTPSPQTQTISPPSFTLVQDHPSHKSRPYSTTPDSFRELPVSVDLQPSTNRDRKLLPAFSSPLQTPPVASPRDGAQFYEDLIPASPTTAQDVFNTHHEDTPQPTSVHLRSKRPKSRRTTSSASSSSRDFFICGGLDTSGSAYSQASLHSSLGATAGNQLQATSRRATDGSFASLTSSDSRRRKFAVRRQAIYAEFGFKLAFPESDSSSSIRHTHIPQTSSSRDFAEAGSSRAASTHVGPRSVWSASTSAASIRSQLQHDADADPADDDDDDPRYSEHLNLPYPSTLSLANLSNAERFSVKDAFLSSSRNPLLDDYADLMTSTPPAKPRPQAQHSASLNRLPLASLLEVEAPLINPGERLTTEAGIYPCGFELQPWPPLRLAGIDPESGCAIIRPSSSTLERAQMFAKWQDDPGHHPIVQQLLNAVDLAIREWNRGGLVRH
ncbi:hypothetical protein LXA43DRAFT_604545 [Ganoderma leucocontextum]|nr:hypothetical protein LXA43DRAFT_604545 [Ganoderma leucocontextum]